jgi:hypothetical protein
MRRHQRLLAAGAAVLVTAGLTATQTWGDAAQPTRGGAAHQTRAAAAPTLRVTPKIVRAGERVRAVGRRWPPRVRVHLLIGPPNSEASHAAWARTTRRGRLRKSVRIEAGTAPGTWVMLACRRQCAVKRLAKFQVVP